jgi:iron complex outermembrane receptor protein
MNKFTKYILNSSIGLLFVFSLNITSQEIEEVVVTATKKAESVQDLAISIEAFTAQSMEDNLIKDASDLGDMVPGLIMDKGIGSGVSYAIRGTGSYGVGAAVVGAVVVSENGHDVGSSGFYDLGFLDVERVEVLKGPQGTLFGRNAVVGVINQVTKRPTTEFGGKFDILKGNFGQNDMTGVINIPISDKLRTRLAVTTSTRDGFTINLRDNSTFNDKDAEGGRLSIDYDISDTTFVKFNHSFYKAEDSRNNIGTIVCEPHALLGCNPLAVGSLNLSADSRGSTAALFNLVAGLEGSAFVNQYAGVVGPNSFREAYLTRNPDHKSEWSNSQLEFVTELTSELQLSVKLTHTIRDYFHMGDNDYSHSERPFPGILAAYGLPAVSFPATFGGNFNGTDYSFTETVTGDRTYEFSNATRNSNQGEITIVSDYDGPINFTAGLYTYDSRSHNRYQVQTAAWNLTSDFSAHPYNNALYGGAFGAYGGIPFYQTWVLGGLAGSAACQSGVLGPYAAAGGGATTNPYCLQGLLNYQGINPYHLPTELRGYLNDDHVRIKSNALLGELYVDLSDVTKLTIGLRYNDDTVKDSIMTCLTDFDCPNYPQSQWDSGEYGFFPTYETVKDDGLAYKLAIQHDLSDNQMIYASYTTATKAGGNNPVIGSVSDPYAKEETGVFEIGTKSILFDGKVLFNASLFMNTTDGMLISNIENAGSKNYNIDAEIMGFEGNMLAFLSETMSIDINWLLVESELGDQRLPDPINPGNVVALLDVNPAGFTPGVAGCATAIGLCTPTALGAGLQSLPYDPAGAVTYGWAVGADGNPMLIFKSAGYLCLQPFNPLGGVPCTGAGLGGTVDISGNSLPQSPKSSFGIGVNKDMINDNSVTSLRVSYRYQGEREGNVFNQDRARMPETKYWDMSATYRPNGSDWYVRVYGKNLADDQFVGTWAASSALQGGAQFSTYTDPRTYGLEFGTSF